MPKKRAIEPDSLKHPFGFVRGCEKNPVSISHN
jgi:hypothetical protein